MGVSISTFSANIYATAKASLAQLARAVLPSPVIRYVVAHPIRTFFHALSGLTLLFPGLMTVPLLSAFGWTALGPRAASFASMAQSGIGSLRAGSALSTLQSAAMGGYGTATVLGATRALVVVSEGVVAVIKRRSE